MNNLNVGIVLLGINKIIDVPHLKKNHLITHPAILKKEHEFLLKHLECERYILDEEKFLTESTDTVFQKIRNFSGIPVAELKLIEIIENYEIYPRPYIYSFKLGYSLDESFDNIISKMYIKRLILVSMKYHASSIEFSYQKENYDDSAFFYLDGEEYEKKEYVEKFNNYNTIYGLSSFINIIPVRIDLKERVNFEEERL